MRGVSLPYFSNTFFKENEKIHERLSIKIVHFMINTVANLCIILLKKNFFKFCFFESVLEICLAGNKIFDAAK